MSHFSHDIKAASPKALGDAELLEIYDFALSLGRRAGKILLDGVDQRCGEEGGRGQNQVDKMNAVDIVTQTDHGWLPRFLFFSHDKLLEFVMAVNLYVILWPIYCGCFHNLKPR